jgi:hypothetical protein
MFRFTKQKFHHFQEYVNSKKSILEGTEMSQTGSLGSLTTAKQNQFHFNQQTKHKAVKS